MAHRPFMPLPRTAAVLVLQAALCVPLAAQTVSAPGWGFSFPLPAGWKVEKGEEGALLGHDTIPGLIIVFLHSCPSLAQMRAEMQQGIVEEQTELAVVGDLVPFGTNGLAGDIEGYFQGGEARGRTLGVVSPSGGGVYVVAVSTPAMYGRQLGAAAEQVAKGIRFSTGGSTDLARLFAGTWATMTTHSQSTVTLGADGSFSIYSESAYSGSFSDQGGSDAGSWGSAGAGESRGRWTAEGTREKGVITLIYDGGGRARVPFAVHVEKGQVYWNEYFFDGVLYGRSR